MNELGPDARAFLEAARDVDDPTSADRARVRRSLFARLAAGGALILVTSSIGVVATAKVLLPVALLLAAGAEGGRWWYTHRRAAAPVAALAPAPQPLDVAEPAPSSAAAAPRAADAVSPLPRAVPSAAPARAGDRRVTTARRLEQETELLARANSLLRAEDFRGCLALLEQYDRRFSDGVLLEEASAVRVIARCRLTPGMASKQEAVSFVRQHASTPLASRVTDSCARTEP